MNKDCVRQNIYIFSVVIVFIILIIRLITMPIVAREYVKYSKTAKEIIDKSRIRISDRHGNILAENIISYDFYIDLSSIVSLSAEISKIQKALPNITKNELIKIFEKAKDSGRKKVLIKQGLLPLEVERVKDNGVLGVEFEEKEKRFYVHRNLFSHVLGFVSSDSVGIAGIEKTYDSYLKNKDNKAVIELSLDYNIQNIVRDNVHSIMNKYSAKAAFGLLVNIKTGEVLSAVSLPDFDLNNLSGISSNEFFNRFSLGVYEMGSVLKVFTAAIAEEYGWDKTKICHRDENGLTIKGKTIKDFTTTGTIVNKDLSFLDIFRYSSNTCCAKIIEQIGEKNQHEFFKKIGLFDKIDTDIPETGRTIFKKKPTLIDAVVASYGHAIAISPLQYVYSLANIINGYKTRITFLKQNDDMIYSINKELIIKKSTTDTVKEVMLYNFLNSGSKAKSNYKIGIKSGTAIQQKNGVYNSKDMILNMVATYPGDEPKYIMLIGIMHPSVDESNEKQIYGSAVLSNTMADSMQLIIPFLD